MKIKWVIRAILLILGILIFFNFLRFFYERTFIVKNFVILPKVMEVLR